MAWEQLDMFGDVKSEALDDGERTEFRQIRLPGDDFSLDVETPELGAVGPQQGSVDEIAGREVGSLPGHDAGFGAQSEASYDGGSGSGLESDTGRLGSVVQRLGSLENGFDSFGNYHITDTSYGGSNTTRVDWNIEALEVLKALEGRSATREERVSLSRYSGWGSLGKYFTDSLTGKDLERKKRIEELTSKEEYGALKSSTLNAHYTDPRIAKEVWKGILKMGFAGGHVLEPSAGTGLFIGTAPTEFKNGMVGVELDPITGRIAQELYPGADIRICGFEELRVKKGDYSLVIGNVPFGNYKIYEKKNVATEGLPQNELSIHDFFLAKSNKSLKEGGVMALITSRYSMDSQDSTARQLIAQESDLVGAIRLPDNAFMESAGTEVVTDILVFQKRKADQEMSRATKDFIETSEVALTDKDGELKTFYVNNYFKNNPQNIIGVEKASGTMYRGASYNVEFDGDSEEFYQKLEDKFDSFPKGIFDRIVDKGFDPSGSKLNFNLQDLEAAKTAEFELKNDYMEGEFVLTKNQGVDGHLFRYENGKFVLHECYQESGGQEKRLDVKRVKRLVELKSYLKDIFKASQFNQMLLAREKLALLEKKYDLFVKEYGYLNDRNNKNLLLGDTRRDALLSLEKWDKSKKVGTKGDIFNGEFLNRKPIPSHVETPLEALVLSLTQYGKVSVDYMSRVTGKSKEEVVGKLLSDNAVVIDPDAFEDGLGEENYITREKYLSGNIREKRRQAERLAHQFPELFNRNKSIIEAAPLVDLTAGEIILNINNPVVREEDIRAFMFEKFEISNTHFRNSTRVDHAERVGKWEIKSQARLDFLVLQKYGLPEKRVSPFDLIEALMNGKQVKVYFPAKEGEQAQLDVESTTIAQGKQELLHEEFRSWVFTDAQRTEDLVREYNERFNCLLPQVFIHPERVLNPDAEIRFPGSSFTHPMRPHQADGVYRALQSDNTLLSHAVGAGKTAEMVTIGHEIRRLGLNNKPVFVVPNHMLEQWSNEYKEIYPQDKVLIADDGNFKSKEDRRRFVNSIGYGDWDAVIITFSSFELIPVSPEYEAQFLEEKRAEYEMWLEDVKKENGQSETRAMKSMAKAMKNYDAMIAELRDQPKEEGVLYFEELGIDALFVDEADTFKNLNYSTALEGVRGLGNPEGSKRALDMLMKVRCTQKNDGKIVFATGTPISNSLVEAYSMQVYLQKELLESQGITNFDEWARQYAGITTGMEPNNTGTGYKAVTRFSKIINVPELVRNISMVWDIKSANWLEANNILVPGKNLPLKNIENVATQTSVLQKQFFKCLEEREKKLKGPSVKGGDNVLRILGDGRKASVDMRLIDKNFPDDPKSKLNVAVDNIYNLYHSYNDKKVFIHDEQEKFTQAVFFEKPRTFGEEFEDDGVEAVKTLEFDGVSDMIEKLVGRGIPREDIIDVRDCKTKPAKQEAFRKIREGESRIIFGSTESMGAGTNFQKYLKAIHHIDAPWRPRDIEQSNGRGYRSGNTTGNLQIFNYVTRGSLDTGLWSLLEIKGKAISGVMDGLDKDTRILEEDYFGSVKDLSIEDDIIRECGELNSQINKMKSMRYGFQKEKDSAQYNIRKLPDSIVALKKNIEILSHDLSLRTEELKGDDFKMELLGKTHDNRKEASALLVDLLLKLKHENKNIDKSMDVGKYGGFELKITNKVYDAKAIGSVIIQGKDKYYIPIEVGENIGIGPVLKIHNFIYGNRLSDMKASWENEIIESEKKLQQCKTIVTQVWPKEEEYQSKLKRYDEVLKLIEERKIAEEKRQKESGELDQDTFPFHDLPLMSADYIKELAERLLAKADGGKVIQIDDNKIVTVGDTIITDQGGVKTEIVVGNISESDAGLVVNGRTENNEAAEVIVPDLIANVAIEGSRYDSILAKMGTGLPEKLMTEIASVRDNVGVLMTLEGHLDNNFGKTWRNVKRPLDGQEMSVYVALEGGGNAYKIDQGKDGKTFASLSKDPARISWEVLGYGTREELKERIERHSNLVNMLSAIKNIKKEIEIRESRGKDVGIALG